MKLKKIQKRLSKFVPGDVYRVDDPFFGGDQPMLVVSVPDGDACSTVVKFLDVDGMDVFIDVTSKEEWSMVGRWEGNAFDDYA